MKNIEEIVKDLTCPITQDLFEDPITVPCCGKAFSRNSLVEYFNYSPYKRCPLCNDEEELVNFDPKVAAKNVILSSLVEQIKADPNKKYNNGEQQLWSSFLTPLVDKNGKTLKVATLDIQLEKSKFVTKPSLFIAVVDRSGSMAGSPWKQVETALIHIMGMTRTNPLIKTVIVAYDSYAEIINTNGTQDQVNEKIKKMFTGGGTNFLSAFEKIREVLSMYICTDDPKMRYVENNISNVTVAFLTDGQASENRDLLIKTFNTMIADS